MTATAFIVQDERGPVSVHARRVAAESIAERIGCDVVARPIEVGQTVVVTWQGWTKRAVVVSAEGSQISVEFALATGKVTKRMSVDKIKL